MIRKTALGALALTFAVTAACSSTPTSKAAADAATTTTEALTTTSTHRVAVTTTTVDRRPGNPQVYVDIAAETDCPTLQESFDRAEATSKRPGGPVGTTWSKIGIAYMKAADDRMNKIDCY